jgi:transcriptional regulator with XRE-family HTH domain
MTLHERLQKRADELGVKQVDLCKKLGIPKTTMNGYFKGTREPDIETLKLLARALGVTVGHLIGDIDAPKPLTTEELIAQQGISNPEHIAALLNIMELMKADAETDSQHGEYLENDLNVKRAN